MDTYPEQIGPYRLRHEIGRSALYIDYRAEDTHSGQEVLLKLPGDTFPQTPARLTRFVSAGQRATGLDHPNIVQVYAAGEADGHYYIASAYTPGERLTDLLANRETPLDPEQALEVVADITTALDYAHDAGIVHDGLTTDNIIIANDGRVLVDDFCLAEGVDVAATRSAESPPAFETFFLAPEQLRDDVESDDRADVFGLGVVTYAMMTRRLPFEAKSQGALQRSIVNDPPRPAELVNPDLPTGIAYVLKNALAKDSSVRYGGAGEFYDALVAGLAWNPAAGSAASLTAGTAGGGRKLGGIMVALIALVAIAAGAFFFLGPTDELLDGTAATTEISEDETPTVAVVAAAGASSDAATDQETSTSTSAPTNTPTGMPSPTVTAIPGAGSDDGRANIAAGASITATAKNLTDSDSEIGGEVTQDNAGGGVSGADTDSPTATRTNTLKPTATATNTPRPTVTATSTSRPTATATSTSRPTATATSTSRPTATATSTSRPTATATSTLRPTATATNTPRPTATATNTPRPTATATNTPRPTATATNTPKPTATATKKPLPTATETNTPSPTATATNTPLPLPTSTLRATATVTPIPAGAGAVQLLQPVDNSAGNESQRFQWVASVRPGEGQAFELVFWRAGQNPLANGFGLAAPTTNNEISVDLSALDSRLGDLLEPGEYLWGLLLVQTDPYQRIQFMGAQNNFRFYREGGSGSSGGPPSSGE